jgi:glyoxylase-like metal-dependent hydrolase (beta-lactamase superfamily II)
MVHIFTPGQFNNNTWLIDAAFKDLEGKKINFGNSAYLIKTEDDHNCLINPATKSGAQSIYRALKRLGGWPLEKIIITHSHWDHTQGINFFRDKVVKESLNPIEVYASEKAIPYLKDQSYNECFVAEEYYASELPNLEGIIPLKNGEIMKIGKQFSLNIIETPGHMVDHISVYDVQNKSIFVGDTIGMSWYPGFFICNANSTFWDKSDYLKSIKEIQSFNLDYLCIAHFGVFTEQNMASFINSSIETYSKWMNLFEKNENHLDDPSYITDLLWENVYKEFSKVPNLKDTIVNSVINALQYFKGLKNK